jgi:hypothetical protein
MTARIAENVSTWLVDWSILTIMGNTLPETPRTMMILRTKTTPNQTTTSIQRLSENPTNSPHAAHLSPKVNIAPGGRTLTGV